MARSSSIRRQRAAPSAISARAIPAGYSARSTGAAGWGAQSNDSVVAGADVVIDIFADPLSLTPLD
jgi:hypothetical protein